jgi:hypothetical protein
LKERGKLVDSYMEFLIGEMLNSFSPVNQHIP